MDDHIRRITGQPSIGMQKQQNRSLCHGSAPVHLPGPAFAGPGCSDLRQVDRSNGLSFRTAVHHDDFMTGCGKHPLNRLKESVNGFRFPENRHYHRNAPFIYGPVCFHGVDTSKISPVSVDTA